MLNENAQFTCHTTPTLWRATPQDSYTAPGRTLRQKTVEARHAAHPPYANPYRQPTETNSVLPPPIRILLIDPSVIVCAGLRAMLNEEVAMSVVGETGQAPEALHLAQRLQPQVILLDLMGPEQGGVELIGQLHHACPTSYIVVLTTFGEEQRVQAALQAGAIGYLLKDVQRPELLRAIRAAACGEPTLHPVAQRALMRQATHSPFQCLTERELDVLRLLGRGCSNRAIAETLCLTEGTVKGYVSTVLAKLQVADRTQAALYAVKHGLGNQ